MDPFIGGSLIMAGSSLLGGLMGQSSQKKALSAQMALADRQMEMQKQFAQQGIRWRVEDAQKAGIHPLYALGAQPQSFSPVSISADGSSPMGDALSSMGQDIGRAMMAKQTAGERFNAQVERLKLENMELNNDLLRSQIARNYGVSLPPPMPNVITEPLAPPEAVGSIMSQAAGTELVPVELNMSTPGQPAKQAGAVNDYAFTYTADGGLTLTPSKDVKELVEDDFVQQLLWSLRNQVVPHFSEEARGQRQPSRKEFPLPEGYEWVTEWPYTTWYPKKVW